MRSKIYQNWPRNNGRVFFVCFVLFSHPVSSDSLRPHRLQHTRPPCPSPSPGVCPTWTWMFIALVMHPAISSDALLSFCSQSFPASGTFPMNHLFASDDQNTRASASLSGLPVNIQGWSPLRLTGLISLISKGLSGLFSSTTVWRDQFFGVLPSLRSSSHNRTWSLGSPDYMDFCQQSTVSAFNTLSLSSLSCQEAIICWVHGFSHHRQWFWSPRRGNLSLLLLAMQ